MSEGHVPEEPEEPAVPDPAEISARAREQLEAEHSALESRLQEIEAQAKKGKGHYQQAMPKPGDDRAQGMTGEQGKSLGVGLTVAYAILGVPLVMFGIGFLIDKAAHSGQFWQSALGLVGCLIGVGFAMYVAQRAGKS